MGAALQSACARVQTKPGARDDANFEQHWSVASWRDHTWPPPGGKLTTVEGAQLVLRDATERARAANVLQDTVSATYWAYHIARLGFFIAQSAGSLAAQMLLSDSPQPRRARWLFGDGEMDEAGLVRTFWTNETLARSQP